MSPCEETLATLAPAHPKQCPVCQSQVWIASTETALLKTVICPSCGLWVGTHASQKKGHSDYDQIWQQAPTEYVDLLGALRCRQAKRWEQLLREEFPDKPALIDFGAGRGWFTRTIAELGWNATGSDASVEALEHLKKDGIPTVQINDFRQLPALAPHAKILTALDVIEHLKPDDLVQFMNMLSSWKTLDGVLLKVPSNHGFFFRLARCFAKLGRPGPWHQLWQVGTHPPHEIYFNEKSLRMLLEKTSLKFVRIDFEHDFEPNGLLARIASLPKFLRTLDRPLSRLLWCLVSLTKTHDSLIILARRSSASINSN